jgi:hypothetical protein
VGAEYILLEKASGTALHRVWDDMYEEARQGLIDHIVQLETQLAQIHLPHNGALYFREFKRWAISGDLGACFYDLD